MRFRALLFVGSNPCNTYLTLTPQLLYPLAPILYFPRDEQWLPSMLLNPGLSFEKSLLQGLSQHPCPTKKLLETAAFLKSHTKNLFFPECIFMSIKIQKSELKFLALQNCKASLALAFIGSPELVGFSSVFHPLKKIYINNKKRRRFATGYVL